VDTISHAEKGVAVWLPHYCRYDRSAVGSYCNLTADISESAQRNLNAGQQVQDQHARFRRASRAVVPTFLDKVYGHTDVPLGLDKAALACSSMAGLPVAGDVVIVGSSI
jgi:hypothetical protein